MAKQKAEQEAAVQTEEKTQEVSLLDKILTDGRMAHDEFQKERSKDMIAEFVGQVMSGELTMTKNMTWPSTPGSRRSTVYCPHN